MDFLTNVRFLLLETACQVERKMAISMDDSFVPDCQEDGSYAPVQCFQHLGFGKQCWCVDDKGQEVPDTRTMDGMTPTCEKGEGMDFFHSLLSLF